jgi:o-succinylbenzoate synthase
VKLTLAPFSLTLRSPLRTAHGELRERTGFTVELRDGQGGEGVGEACPLPDFGTEPIAQTRAALEEFSFEGPVDDLPSLERALLPLSAVPAARHAVETAALELLARRAGLPLVRLLSATSGFEVVCSALIDGSDAEHLARAAAQAVAEGFGCLKVKVAARSLPVDAQRLLEVRRAIGAQVQLRIDANGGWSEVEARTALRGFESLALELCEQPVRAHDVEALRRLRGKVPCRLGADEVLQSAAQRERVLERDPIPAADVLVLKPMALGGVLPALALARRAAQVGVPSFVTTLIDGPRALAAAAHLAGALAPSPFAHGLATGRLFEEGAVPVPRGGVLHLSDAPGTAVREGA